MSNVSNCCCFDDVNVQPNFFKNSLALLHFNICSLHRNFHAVYYNFLQSLNFLPNVIRVGLNLNFEFESAHELLMNLNLTFAKSMNLNLAFSKSMNLNSKIKNKMNGSNQCHC